MVISVAARAAAKIAAKKAAIAKAHRIKKTVKPRVKKTVKPRVKKTSLLDASGNQIYTKSGKPKTKKRLQKAVTLKQLANQEAQNKKKLKAQGWSESQIDAVMKPRPFSKKKTSIKRKYVPLEIRKNMPPSKGNLQEKELFYRLPPKQRLPPWSRPTKKAPRTVAGMDKDAWINAGVLGGVGVGGIAAGYSVGRNTADYDDAARNEAKPSLDVETGKAIDVIKERRDQLLRRLGII